MSLIQKCSSPLVIRFVSLSAILLFAFFLASPSAHAQGPQCTFAMTNISFGTVDLQKGNPYDAAGTFTYACTGNSREILRICPSWGIASDGTRWMTNSTGNKLIYNLYSDESRHTVWGSWYGKSDKAPSIDVPLGRSEKTLGSVPVYGRIAANQQSLAPGSYSATINKSNAAITYGYTSQGTCEVIKNGAKSSVGMTVSATVSGNGAGPGAITAPDATKPSATNGGQVSPGQSQEHRSMMQKLADNAKYQEQQRANGSSTNSSNNTSQSKQEDRAKYLETHACMTTDGADKANELADDCNKVTSSPHKGCNIQQNTCDEIRKNTQKGCWGLAASAPDFCFTKYR
jgi:spore coat protein U-like protein